MPRISVIVPVYDVEPYIACCIDSILSQVFSDFELILIDDGSPDNCGAICDEYGEKDSRIRVIHQKNQGVSAARNHGVSVAKGEYVTFVDSDDWLDPLFLERMYQAIVSHDADMSVSNITQIRVGEKAIPRFGDEQFFDSREAVEYYAKEYDDRFTGPMVKLLRKEIVLQYPFPTDRTYAEDKAVTYKWFYASRKTVDTGDRLYYYRVREGSAMRSGYKVNRLANLQTLEEILEFLKENHFDSLRCLFIHRYLDDLVRQYQGVIQYVGDQKLADGLMEKMKAVVRNEKKACSISPNHDPEYYNLMYPKRMRGYWMMRSLIAILKNEGIKGLISRIRKRGMS